MTIDIVILQEDIEILEIDRVTGPAIAIEIGDLRKVNMTIREETTTVNEIIGEEMIIKKTEIFEMIVGNVNEIGIRAEDL